MRRKKVGLKNVKLEDSGKIVKIPRKTFYTQLLELNQYVSDNSEKVLH